MPSPLAPAPPPASAARRSTSRAQLKPRADDERMERELKLEHQRREQVRDARRDRDWRAGGCYTA
jgi:hypothetical protein